MKYAVLYSRKDEAGRNIAEQLKKYFLPQVVFIELAKESIYCEEIDEKDERLRDVDFIIFATRHQSKESRKTFSLHAPGNWRNADFGGKVGKICSANATAMKFLFQRLSENAEKAGSDYELTMECTHHGPLIKKPCCFIEIGTTKEQWNDRAAGEIIAKTLNDFQGFNVDRNIKSAVGIGGPHYCPNFNKIQLSDVSRIAIGHVIPEYAFPVNESTINEVIEKSPGVNLFVIDWKGCGNSESRQKIINLIEKTGISWERTERINK
jgi:D-aminoacyl-tRNA deacylase